MVQVEGWVAGVNSTSCRCTFQHEIRTAGPKEQRFFLQISSGQVFVSTAGETSQESLSEAKDLRQESGIGLASQGVISDDTLLTGGAPVFPVRGCGASPCEAEGRRIPEIRRLPGEKEVRSRGPGPAPRGEFVPVAMADVAWRVPVEVFAGPTAPGSPRRK